VVTVEKAVGMDDDEDYDQDELDAAFEEQAYEDEAMKGVHDKMAGKSWKTGGNKKMNRQI